MDKGFFLFRLFMGLYSPASFIMNARIKEIAVRKVIGAGSLTIGRMLMSEFSVLVLLSILVATDALILHI